MWVFIYKQTHIQFWVSETAEKLSQTYFDPLHAGLELELLNSALHVRQVRVWTHDRDEGKCVGWDGSCVSEAEGLLILREACVGVVVGVAVGVSEGGACALLSWAGCVSRVWIIGPPKIILENVLAIYISYMPTKKSCYSILNHNKS